MKHIFKESLLLTLFLFDIASCSTLSLDNAEVQKFDSYTSLGFGTQEAEEKSEEKTSRKLSKIKKQYNISDGPISRHLSEQPFTLVGSTDDKIENLQVSLGNRMQGINIKSYCDLPGFIGFSYGNEYSGDKYYLYTVSSDYQFRNCPCWEWGRETNTTQQYLLSKKTGKIYDFTKASSDLDLGSTFIGGSGALYVKCTSGQVEDWCYYRLVEEDNELFFNRAFSYNAFESLGRMSVDKYGNFLTEKGEIVTTEGQIKRAEEFSLDAVTFHYDWYFDLIYTQIKGEYYYLNEKSELVKADGKIGCVNSDDSLLVSYNDLIVEDSNAKYYYYLYMGSVVKIEVLSDFSYSVSFLRDISNKDSLVANGVIYFLRDNKIYQYNPITDDEKELQVDGYRLNNLSLDDYGNVKVTGYDSSLSYFIGYLMKDGTISMKPVITDGYMTYSLTPINK